MKREISQFDFKLTENFLLDAIESEHSIYSNKALDGT